MFQASCTKIYKHFRTIKADFHSVQNVARSTFCDHFWNTSNQTQRIRLTERIWKESDRKKLILWYFALNGNRPECYSLLRRGFSHRIDTRPEGTLLCVLVCVLAWEKRPNFFTCYAILECTRHILPMKNICVHSMMASYGVFFTSALVLTKYCLSEWHFWSSIYSVR
jgi:hypothetical protein